MAMTAEQVIELKAKLKAELARRNGLGSVAEFASEQYEFNEVPQAGKPITADQGKKIIDLLLQICDYKDLRCVVKGDTLPEAFDAELLDLVDKLSQEQSTGEITEESSCRGLCTGLCVGSCINNCNGCIGCTGQSGAKIYGHGVMGVKGTINKIQ
jgi:hypothetical protein